MPKILDPGEGENRLPPPKKFKAEKSPEQAERDAAEAAREIGQQAGVSSAMRWAYWQYLYNWNRCGKRGRRWTPRDVMTAHRALAEATQGKGNNVEHVAGLRRFLLLDEDCGKRKTDTDEANDTSEPSNGGSGSQGRAGDVPDQPAVRPRKKGRPKA